MQVAEIGIPVDIASYSIGGARTQLVCLASHHQQLESPRTRMVRYYRSQAILSSLIA